MSSTPILVVGIIGTSGSMSRYSTSIKQNLISMELMLHGSGNRELHIITFSSEAQYCRDIANISWNGQETNLLAPFELLETMFGERIRSLTESDPRAVIFLVSDGDHQSKTRRVGDLKLLRSMGDRCTLLSVAIGNSFQTTTLLNVLRGLYNGGDPLHHLPATIAVRAPYETTNVLTGVESIARTVDWLVQPLLPSTGTPEIEIIRCIHATANRTVLIACMAGATPDTTRLAIDATLKTLRKAREVLVDSSSEESLAARRACVMYTTHLAEIRQKCLDGVDIPAAPDKEKLRILSFGASDNYAFSMCSRYIRDDVRRHIVVQWRESLDSLIDCARGFRGGCGGQEEVNALTFQTEDDMMLAIKADMAGVPCPPDDTDADTMALWHADAEARIDAPRRAALHVEITGIAAALKRWPLPFLGLATGRANGASRPSEIEVWYWAVLKDTAKLLTTVDSATFFERSGKLMQSAGMPVVDDMLLQTSLPALGASPFAAHACAFMLTRDSLSFHTMAYPVAMAGVALKILSTGTSTEYERGVLSRIIATHDASFMSGGAPHASREREEWVRFVPAAAGFATMGHALVPKSECGQYRCGDLRKAIFALFVRHYAHAGVRSDVAEWTVRRRFLLLEFFVRNPRMKEVIDEMVMPTKELRRAVERFLERDCQPMSEFFGAHPTRRGAVHAFTQMAYARAGRLLRTEGASPASLDEPVIRGLSPEIIDGICRSLCPLLPRLRHTEALACMQAAYSVVEAGDMAHREARYTSGDFMRDAVVDWRKVNRAMILPRLRPMLHDGIKEFAERQYDEMFKVTHETTSAIPPTPDLDVGPYGLPRNACACPKCPFAYRALGPPATGPDGRPRIAPALRAHLAPMHAIPGLHKTLYASDIVGRFRAATDNEAKDQIVDDAVQAVVSGKHLEQTDRAMVILKSRLRACYGRQTIGGLFGDIWRQLDAIKAGPVTFESHE